MKIQALAAVLLPLALCGQALAQDSAPAAAPAPVAAAAPAAGTIMIPEGTLVELETLDHLSSAANHKGDFFKIRLLGPIVVDGVTLIPAGTQGVGQVTVATASGFGGKAGEMMVLARYLEIGGVRVPLRGFTLGNRGRNNAGVAMLIPYGAGIFVKGGNVEIPAGTNGQAKIAQSIALPPAPVQAAAAEVAPVAEAPATPAS